MILVEIHQGIADRRTHVALLNRIDQGSDKHHLGLKPGQFWQISREIFEEANAHTHPGRPGMLSFALPNTTTMNLTESLHHIGDRFFCVTIEHLGARSIIQARAELANLIAGK